MAVDYMAFKEALVMLEIAEEDLESLVASAKLRGFRAGSSIRFKREDVEKLKQALLLDPTFMKAALGQTPNVHDDQSDLLIDNDDFMRPGAPDAARARDVVVVPRAPVAISDRHAVIVGVGRFASAGVAGLPCAERDASNLRDVLTDPARAGVDAGNVKLLLGADATLDAVKRALGVFLERSAAEDDLVLLYFATHGLVQGREGYLLLHDSDPASPFRTALRMGELATILDSLSTGNVVLILDACHAGATTPSEAWYRMLDGFGASAGSRVVLAACGAAEQSLELAFERNGLFTKHLLAGLRGDADHRRQGAVGIEDLFTYVRDHVRDDAARIGRKQTPSWWGKVQSPMLITHDPVGQHPQPGVIHRRGAPRLLVLDDVGPRIRLRLTGKCTTIGRHPDCDVQLMGDRGVSRDHATIERRDGGWVLTTQAPAGRTCRNGAAVPPGQPQRLADGDELRLGSTRLLFLWDGAPTPSENTGRVELAERSANDRRVDELELDCASTQDPPPHDRKENASGGAEEKLAPTHQDAVDCTRVEDQVESICDSQPESRDLEVEPSSADQATGALGPQSGRDARAVACHLTLRSSKPTEPFRAGDKSVCSLFILDFAALSSQRQEEARALAAEVRGANCAATSMFDLPSQMYQRMLLLPVLEFCTEQELLHARRLFDAFEIPTRVAYGFEDLTPGEVDHLCGSERRVEGVERRADAPTDDEVELDFGSTQSLPDGSVAVDHLEAIWSSDQDMGIAPDADLQSAPSPPLNQVSGTEVRSTPLAIPAPPENQGHGLLSRLVRAFTSDNPGGSAPVSTSDRYMLEIHGLHWPDRRDKAVAVLARLRGCTEQEAGALCRDRMVVIEDGTEEEIQSARLQFEAAKVSTRVTRKEPAVTKTKALKRGDPKREGLCCLYVANLSSPELRAAAARILAEARGCSREEAALLCQTPMVLTNCDETLVTKVKERFDARGFSTRVIRVTETSP